MVARYGYTRSKYDFRKNRPYEKTSLRRRFLCLFKRKNKGKKPNKRSKISDPKKYKGNPLIKKEEKRPSLGAVSYLIIFIAIALIWSAIIIYVPFFHITKIEYIGLKNISEIEFKNYINNELLRSTALFPRHNYFFVKTEKITKNLQNKFPIKKVEVEKHFPNEMVIKIEEKITTLIYDNGKNYFLLDDRGILIKELAPTQENEFKEIVKISTSTEGEEITTTTTIHIPDSQKVKSLFGNYPVLFDKRSDLPTVSGTPKQTDLAADFIKNVIYFNEALKEEGMEVAADYYILEDLQAGLCLRVKDGWDILFRAEKDLDVQLKNLSIILKETEGQKKEYINIRQEKRVYWK